MLYIIIPSASSNIHYDILRILLLLQENITLKQ